ncbi:translation initiation factor IF-2, partial [candidate division MSBL1 archaeon SCGC-AAA259J03]
DVKVLQNDVIYRLIEDYEEWVEEEKERIRREKLKGLMRAGKVSIKPGCVFRSSKPAIVGVDVLGGIIRPDFPLMKKDGENIGTVREIQSKQETISEAESGDEVALSIAGPTVGRQIKEGGVLYVDIPSEQMAKLEEVSEMLSEDEKGVMEEITSIKKKKDSAYGVM